MTYLLAFVLRLSMAGSLMALPVLFLRPVLRRKLPQASATVLWAIVLIVFLIPMDIPSPFSVQSAVISGEPAQAVLTMLSMDEPVIDSAPLTSSFSSESTAEAISRPSLSTGALLYVLWLSGALALAGSFLLRGAALRRRFRDAVALDTADYQRYLGNIRRPVRVYASDRLGTAITYGTLRPRIILPFSLLETEEKTITHVILHEAQHIRRLDSLQNALWLCLLCVHWFNPIAWLCRMFARRDRELLCDIGVLQVLGPDSPADYARTILALTPVRDSFGNASSFASLFGLAPTRMRITRILSYRRPKAAAWCTLAVLLGLLLALFAPSTLAAYTMVDPAEVLTALPVPENTTDEASALPAENETSLNISVKLCLASGEEAALDEAIASLSPDTSCRYILLHQQEGRVYNWNGWKYKYYELLGSTDTPDAILGLDGIANLDTNYLGFSIVTNSGNDGSAFINTFECSFSGDIFMVGNTGYVLLDKATYSNLFPEVTVQEAITVICENEWG